MNNAKQLLHVVLKPVLTILIALGIGGIIIACSGYSPFNAYAIMIRGAFGSGDGLMETLAKATPLIFTGLAAAVGFKAGVFNIGVEGQLYMGAFAAAITGVYVGDLPPVIAIFLCAAAAMTAAVLWAVIPGLLHIRMNINIFIMFFMLNNMAVLITQYLANGPFRGEIPAAVTSRIRPNAALYKFSVFSNLNIGFIAAVLLVIALYILFYKTKFGYECDALGRNPIFARYIGIHAKKKTMLLLVISAMIAGLAGAEQSLGAMERFYAGFSNDLGFTGISIALLAGNHPVGVLIFAIFFGALTNGGLVMSASTNVPSDLITILQAILIMLISGDFIIRKVAQRRKETVA